MYPTYSTFDNHQLDAAIARIATGDKEALAELYETTKTAVYSFIFSLLKNKAESEDIFQEVYLMVYDHAASYRANGKPMAWIITIAKNLCYMHFRKIKNHVDMEHAEELWTDDAYIEDRLVLKAAFQEITDEERNIVILHALSGLKHREIAELFNMPLATVLSKYHRAVKKLRAVLEEKNL